MSSFQWFALVSILLVALGGALLPLVRRDEAQRTTGFPRGQAFSAGVFLALALVIMLPAGFHLFGRVLPDVDYPLASLAAIGSYLLTLALGHVAAWQRERDARAHSEETVALGPPAIPLIMTVMIAVPSFLLGTALGVSALGEEMVIYLAILAHKGTAGFALALALVRSRMSRPQALLVYCVFVFSTPLGIVAGADVRDYLNGDVMLVAKAVVLSMAAGVFLYMATLHELKHAPLIVNCCTRAGFLWMLFGLVLTALVRLILGLAHVG